MSLQELLHKIENEMRLRNYSQKTIKSYLACLTDYFEFIKVIKKVPDINLIKQYLLQKQKRNQSPRTINLHLNAIKYFYREIYKSNTAIDIRFSKTSKKLPIVLSREEIQKIISSIDNIKHMII